MILHNFGKSLVFSVVGSKRLPPIDNNELRLNQSASTKHKHHKDTTMEIHNPYKI